MYSNLAMVYDTETTGMILFKEPSESADQPHIVQAAARLICLDTRALVSSFNVIVKPDGWEIPHDATAVHGITTEKAIRCGIPEDVVIDMFYNMAAAADFRIGFNESFDARMVRIGLKRLLKDEDAAEAFKNQPVFCAMRAAKRALATAKFPNLTDAYRSLIGKEMTDAHSAAGDALATEELFWALTDRGHGYTGNSDLVGLG